MNIYCIGSDPVVRHGAEELRRYAAKIAGAELNVVDVERYRSADGAGSDPNGGDTHSAGIWIGTREQFGDVFADPGLTHPLDDGFYIRSVGRPAGPVTGGATGGPRLLLAGVNPRSVLFAVYAYLESLGCRWVRMGQDGDVLPSGVELKLDGYDVAEFPDYRHRGICIEGGVSLEHTFDLVEYMVKQRFNTYFIQFQHAYIFWSRWYDRLGTANTMPMSDAETYTARLAERIKARGLALQMVGHGWTCESIGQPGLGWINTEMNLPAEKQELIALVNGERTWWKGVPIDTELCMSNLVAFRGLVDYIVGYTKDHPGTDLLHVWLSDGWNNRCECDCCAVKRPSDWYVDLLNELDVQLDAAGLDTKIVFLAYADLLWAPETSRLRNQDRFILMFAPLTRTWRTTLLGSDDGILTGADWARDVANAEQEADGDAPITDVQGGLSDPTRAAGERPTPFRLNKNTFPTSTSVNVHYFHEWQRQFSGDSFAFDYHLLWKHSIVEPTGLKIAKVLHEDIQQIGKLNLNGLVNCQVQRYFFPTGLAMDVTAKTLWDKELSFAAIARDHFEAAFGKHGPTVQRHLERLSDLLDADVLFTTNPAPDPEYEQRVDEAAPELEQLSAYVEAALTEEDGLSPAVAASLRYLDHAIRFTEVLLPGFRGIARGDTAALSLAYRAAADYVVEHEPDLHTVVDNRMWANWLETYASDYENADDEKVIA